MINTREIGNSFDVPHQVPDVAVNAVVRQNGAHIWNWPQNLQMGTLECHTMIASSQVVASRKITPQLG